MAELDLVRTRDAAAILGVNIMTIYRWVNADPPVLTPAMEIGDTPNAAMLFHRTDIEALADRRRQENSA